MNKMRGCFAREVLVDGNEKIIDLSGATIPATLWVNPLGGDTVNLWVSFDNMVTWVTWPNSAVTSFSYLTMLSGASHIKAQRTVGTGNTSSFGVS